MSNKYNGTEQHIVSILDRAIPTEMSSHLDETGFIVKSKRDRYVVLGALLGGRKKGSNHLRISNLTFQEDRMKVIGVGITKDRADCNGFIGVHGQGAGDQDQPRHDDGSKNA